MGRRLEGHARQFVPIRALLQEKSETNRRLIDGVFEVFLRLTTEVSAEVELFISMT